MPEALQALPGQLSEIFAEPTSNLTAALILYGIIGLAALILLLLGILYLMATPEDEESEAPQGAQEATGIAPEEAGQRTPAPERRPKVRRVWSLRTFLMVFAVSTAIVLAAWLLAGYTTSSSAVCEECHVEGPHVASEAGNDPHEVTRCVSCHEPGGVFGRFVTSVPSRIVHYAAQTVGSSATDEYGRVTSSSCLVCHESDIGEITLDEQRGLRMSHVEPLDAAAPCLDCHTPVDGIVSVHNAGMDPCLQCHDAKTASSECETCHDKTATAAAWASSTDLAKQQIPNVKCGGCHDEQKECDTCHGMRMPHTREFMASAHARAGAVNFWYDGGDTCVKCHTDTRRPCTKCHTTLLGKGHLPTMASQHQSADGNSCNGCHQRFAPTPSRDFCVDMCHSDIAIQESPR